MRAYLLMAGLLVLGAVWLGPLPQLARGAFWAHMTMHMGVVALAAPLLALSVAGSRMDPIERAPRLFSPIAASVLEMVVVWGWHTPVAHQAARQSAAVMSLEQGLFLAAGLLVWISAFGGSPGRAESRAGAGILGLLLTVMHMTLLGALLALAPRPLYAHVVENVVLHGETWNMMALDDQQLGGAIMVLVGGLSYLVGGLWLTARLVRSSRLRAEGQH